MSAKYDKIGKGYNLTRKADKYLTAKLISFLAPNKNGLYLDMGCGTGSYTIEFLKRGYKFIGIDPSERMLEKAKEKYKGGEWRKGSAENPGLPSKYVDGIIASLTIHHWTDLKKAFEELNSVLKAGGKIVIFTSTPTQMKGYWLNHYFPQMLKDSIKQMPALAKIKEAMQNAAFSILETEKYFIQPDLADKFLYSGKHKPELYFDEQIRKGISSFSSLSNKEEVERGLLELKSDIESTKIHSIIKEYENQVGDYLFILGQK